MNAGSIKTSKRLQDTFAALLRHSRYHDEKFLSYCSTEVIRRVTKSQAVHSDIAGLRANGYKIKSKMLYRAENGNRIFGYCLVR